MVLAFIYGLIQGFLISQLASTLLPGALGSVIFAIDFAFNGSSAFSGIILLLIANAAMYILFSSKAMKTNPIHFYLGLFTGLIFLMFF